MYILHVSAECFPIAKVGGLADVIGSLPKYQKTTRRKAKVIMPFYEKEFTSIHEPCDYLKRSLFLGNKEYQYEILTYDKEILGFELLMVKIFGLTDKEEVYGYENDTERFIAFQKAVTDYVLELENKPNIVHCHDHHTGLIPFFMSYAYKYESLKKIPHILTIHNAQYQGAFEFDKLHYLPEFSTTHRGILEWNGQINPLATAIKCAWKVTTVSPNYLSELQKKASGLEQLLANEIDKSIGILNGIDETVWNPKTDELLKENYQKSSIEKRLENKKWICQSFDFNPELPLVSFIGRFVYEKGSDLLPAVIDYIYEELKLDVNLLVLGSGDSNTEQQLNALKEKYPNKYNNFIGYNETLAHVLYGGSDFLLMPSRVEPCGLNQMYAMRYGTIPIVSNVGGLNDTVIDLDQGKKGSGIVCYDVSVHEIGFAIQRAVDVYNNTTFFNKKKIQIMAIDNGWKKSAKEYIKMYQSITTKK